MSQEIPLYVEFNPKDFLGLTDKEIFDSIISRNKFKNYKFENCVFDFYKELNNGNRSLFCN